MASKRLLVQQIDDDGLEQRAKRLAELIKGSKHLVAFTGAGISTSTGVPDYRGENGIRKKKARRDVAAPSIVPDLHTLVPSPTHMALYELYRLGYLKHLVSQNVDNLHRKSGIPQSLLTEVHGNATYARCDTCEKVYTDNFPIGGLCNSPSCPSAKKHVSARLQKRTRHGNGRLKRHVIGFDQPMDDIDAAIDHCELADVALVPLCVSSHFAKWRKTLPRLDKRAEETGVRLYAPCDRVMAATMKYLVDDMSYEIPVWSGEHPREICHFDDDDHALVNVLVGKAQQHLPSVLA
ncbi:hypothetical protein Ae201684P_000877 [Aphanomyces euteiches]|nr:hypothetical protein Ae201684P_000877 [Aphanomyces euteiches]